MADQIYKVRDPSGAIREIRGPAGATDEQVIAKAKELFGGEQPAPEPAAAPAAPKNWRDSMADVVGLARPGAIGVNIGEALGDAAYNAGAFVNDQAAKVMPEKPAAALGTAANVALQSVPMFFGGGVGKGMQPAFELGGEAMMQKALRPTLKALETGKAQTAARTMLNEGLNPTRAGLAALRSGINENMTKVDDLISRASGSLDKNRVAARALIPVLADVEKSPLPTANVNAVQNVWNEFVNHPLLQSGRDISVRLAQEMKQAAHKQLGDSAYGLGLKPAAERDALKALTRELRVGIEGVVPEVAPLNARVSELLNARKVAERRVLMSGNNNVLPLGASVATATNNPAAALGLWANSSDLVKSLIARLLYSGEIPANAGRFAGAGVGYLSGQPALSQPTGALYQQ